MTDTSNIYRSAPWGDTDQADFLNAVILCETSMLPEAFLDAIKTIERNIGRTASRRWGPRQIDIDILAYEDEVRETDTLTLPHPRIFDRLFVLVPLLDVLAADHFCGRSVREAIRLVDDPMPVCDPAASGAFQRARLDP